MEKLLSLDALTSDMAANIKYIRLVDSIIPEKQQKTLGKRLSQCINTEILLIRGAGLTKLQVFNVERYVYCKRTFVFLVFVIVIFQTMVSRMLLALRA